MKQLHRKDLFGWSEFNQERNLDFHSVLWVREQGNLLIDPLALSDHDLEHLQALGGANIIVITNSDHCRDAENIAAQTGAKIVGPVGEQATFPIVCDCWLAGLLIMRKLFPRAHCLSAGRFENTGRTRFSSRKQHTDNR